MRSRSTLLGLVGLVAGAILWAALIRQDPGTVANIAVDPAHLGAPAAPPEVAIESAADREPLEFPPGDVTAPIPAPAEAPQRHLRISHAYELRSLREVLEQLEGRPREDSHWKGWKQEDLVPVLAAMGVAAPMDAAGTTFQPDPEVWTHTGRRSEGKVYDHAIGYNGRTYRFMSGDFPVYDEYIKLSNARSLAELAQDPALPRTPQQPYPEEFVNRLKELGYGALAIREALAQQ